MLNIVFQVALWAAPVILAITLHEAAHGWAASKLGDETARIMGRVTFNPLRHVDPFGTLVLPAMLLLFSGGQFAFGFAKPVPVDFRRLRHPRRDMILVAAAGPGINIVLAAISIVLLHGVGVLPAPLDGWAALMLAASILINIVLALFNLFPLPPLDGGRIAVGLLPRGLAMPLARLEPIGIFLVLGLLFLLPWVGDRLGFSLNIFYWWVLVPGLHLIDFLASLVGLDGRAVFGLIETLMTL